MWAARASYLTGVEPIVELFLAPDAGQNEAVEDVLPKGGEQGATEPNAKEDEEAREVVDPHLQRLSGDRERTGAS